MLIGRSGHAGSALYSRAVRGSPPRVAFSLGIFRRFRHWKATANPVKIDAPLRTFHTSLERRASLPSLVAALCSFVSATFKFGNDSYLFVLRRWDVGMLSKAIVPSWMAYWQFGYAWRIIFAGFLLFFFLWVFPSDR